MGYIGAGISRFNTADELTVTGDATIDTTTLVVDSTNNNVGIGTASPAKPLTVVGGDFSTVLLDNSNAAHGTQILFQANGATNSGADIQMSDAGGMKIRTLAVEPLSFHTSASAGSPSERMRIDASGNVMASCTATVINQSSVAGLYYANDSYLAVSRSSGSPVVLNRLSTDGSVLTAQKNGTTFCSIGVMNTNNPYIANDADNSGLQFGSGSITPAYDGAGQDNSVDLGSSSTRFKDGYFSNAVRGNFFAGQADDNTYMGITGGDVITFATGGSEKGRIDSNGFHFGGTDNNPQASSSSSGGELYYSTQYAFMGMYRPSNPCLLLNRTGSDGEIVQFRKSGSTVGTVSVNGSGTTYNTTSDIRLKQDIEPLEATDKLMAMNPVSYSWKADPDGQRSMGFIAQEMADVMPEAVSTGDDDMMSMDYGRITPILVSALQDAHRKIDELAAEIAELKAN